MAISVRAAALGVAVGLGISSAALATTLDYSVFLPEAFPPNQAEKVFAERLKELTNGELSVRLSFGGTLGGQKEMLDFVANKVVAMANFPGNHYAVQFPAYEAFGLPMVYDTPKQVRDLFKHTLTQVPEAVESYQKQNVTPLMYRGLDPYVLLCNKPVTKIDDFKGLKVRTFGAAGPMMFETLGSIPVNVQTSETYEALQRGTVDCVYYSRVSHMVYKMHEVAKYYVDFEFGSIGGYLSYINNDVLASMTDEQRAAFWQANDEAEVVAQEIVENLDKVALDMFRTKLEVSTIQDAEKIRAMFPRDKMLDFYIDFVGGFGADEKKVAEAVAASLKTQLPQD